MFCYIFGEAAVDGVFYSRFTFELPFFFRFPTWKWLVSYGSHDTWATLPFAVGSKCFWFLIALLLYPKSTIFDYLSSILEICAYQTSFQEDLDKSNLSVHIYLMSKKKLGSFNDFINTYFQSFICLPRDKHFLASIFCKVSFALLNRIQPILERLQEKTTKPSKPSIIDRSEWC